ncbi:2-oxoglutarate dehydrogenase, E2 subunit, dihydrolipoamide succinyltransferase [Psychromonas sp. CNPT3]|uniref:2-oxoglutarate dehydrogenase complex dihydrolipoyllysine-residue succinyltransferase n=1 Tax=Psychromonas sp. CNPT3 TaxID=314282 RepID=UPI00006E4882|nr:2-oxoglutarate dehydrogenase complex dihydrolipoyllysine-residue succinyltransferase [Psychromonas sp. CNPT3]AGH80951.1 2-oxoglutarate dehydrogenase, E2 subunit, dihydrolipoamide succinyltransferase [Psychromonas sp. CNPT3]
MIDILVPELPESVADAGVATWLKAAGDFVERDEVLVEIETDKVVLEVPATASGILKEILEEEGATVLSKQVLGRLEEGDASSASTPASAESASVAQKNDAVIDASPSVRRLLQDKGIDASLIKGTGKGGMILREDVEKYSSTDKTVVDTPKTADIVTAVAARSDKRVAMTRLRKRVAERLLEAKNSTAMLTTFNEVNMQPIMALRKQYQEIFEKKHGVRLGFMSFYIKAVTEALKRYPEVNAAIDGEDIVYHNFFDISIAVSTPRGLVTPVLRDTDTLGLADIEKGIKALAIKGRDGKLTVDEMTGGNFTITNGGVFGSLLSTPIINPPQAAILGMHKIEERPMAINGEVVILPMMYLALSYDHRLIDGKESVGFLVTIKELLEDPTRLLLDI